MYDARIKDKPKSDLTLRFQANVLIEGFRLGRRADFGVLRASSDRGNTWGFRSRLWVFKGDCRQPWRVVSLEDREDEYGSPGPKALRFWASSAAGRLLIDDRALPRRVGFCRACEARVFLLALSAPFDFAEGSAWLTSPGKSGVRPVCPHIPPKDPLIDRAAMNGAQLPIPG